MAKPPPPFAYRHPNSPEQSRDASCNRRLSSLMLACCNADRDAPRESTTTRAIRMRVCVRTLSSQLLFFSEDGDNTKYAA